MPRTILGARLAGWIQDDFYQVFNKIDLARTGQFGLIEFLEYFDILTPTPFYKVGVWQLGAQVGGWYC